MRTISLCIPWDMAASSLDSIVLMHHTTRLPLSSLLTVSSRVPKLSSCSLCHSEFPSCHPEQSEGSHPAPLVTPAPIVYTAPTAPKLCATARRRRSESWTPIHPKTTSSAIPTRTSAGPNGSPGSWRKQATTPGSRPGTSSRAATSSSKWTQPPGRPPVPSLSSPPTISRPSSRPPNGRQRSNVIPQESKDCSCLYGYDPVTWKDCWDRSCISTWWIKTKPPLVLPYFKGSHTSDANPAVHQPFLPHVRHLSHLSDPPFQEPCQPCGTSLTHAIPTSPDAKNCCVD